jgi:hypothetical protein
MDKRTKLIYLMMLDCNTQYGAVIKDLKKGEVRKVFEFISSVYVNKRSFWFAAKPK